MEHAVAKNREEATCAFMAFPFALGIPAYMVATGVVAKGWSIGFALCCFFIFLGVVLPFFAWDQRRLAGKWERGEGVGEEPRSSKPEKSKD